MFGECHAPYTLNTSLIDFEKEKVHCSRYKILFVSSLSSPTLQVVSSLPNPPSCFVPPQPSKLLTRFPPQPSKLLTRFPPQTSKLLTRLNRPIHHLYVVLYVIELVHVLNIAEMLFTRHQSSNRVYLPDSFSTCNKHVDI